METKIDILNELMAISPLVGSLNKVNVFSVPSAYFDTIGPTVLACIYEANKIVVIPDKVPSTEIPEGYFTQLADSILGRIKVMETAPEETRQLSPLLYSLKNENVFDVPASYFEHMPATILNKLTTSNTIEELQSISPLLHSLHLNKTFEVPDQYFHSLPNIILKKVQPATAKIVKMPKRRLIIKYAVAAMMTGVLALGVYKYLDQPGKVAINNRVALDASVEKGRKMNDQQFSETLHNLTEADIAKYLENNGDITDVTALRNNLEETVLPSPEDYLIDGNTLENYIKEIDKTTVNN